MKSLTEIIYGCSKHERQSQQLFYDRYHPLCIAIAFKYVQSLDKAMDISQQALLKIFRHLDRLEVKDAINFDHVVHSWVAKIVKNTSIDHLRRQNRRGRVCANSELMKDYADTGGYADQKLLHNDLVSLIKLLPPAYQNVFNLFVIEGYSHSDIAKMLKIKCGTSKSNLSKARTHLQKMLGKM